MEKRLAMQLFSLFVIVACARSNDSITFALPEGVIPFYNFKNNVIFNGYIHDTVSVKAIEE